MAQGAPSPVHCTEVQPWQDPSSTPPPLDSPVQACLLPQPLFLLSPGAKATPPSGAAHSDQVSTESQVRAGGGEEGCLSGLSILLWEAVPLPSGSQAACQACLSSPSRQLRHTEPPGHGPSSPVRLRGAHGGSGVHLALLCSDMPLPEARGFLKLGPVLSAVVCPNVSQE